MMKEAKTARPTTLQALTISRFFAALCVVISHLHAMAVIDAPLAHRFLDGGRPAVAFFFTLSGFVLAYNYRNLSSRNAKTSFWTARFARIYPIHLLGLLVAGIAIVELIRTGNWSAILSAYSVKQHYELAGAQVGAVVVLAGSLIAQLLLITAWIPLAAFNQPWNGPTWSISCEAFFYSIFPWLLRPIQRVATTRLLWTMSGLWLCQGACLWWLQQVGARGFIVSQFPVTHLFEFVLGASFAQIHIRDEFKVIQRNAAGILACCAALATLCGVFSPLTPRFFLLEPIFGLAILSLAAAEKSLPEFFGRRLLLLAGESSYALYVLHLPLIVLYVAAGRPLPSYAFILLIGMAAVLAHVFVEEPARRALRKAFRPTEQLERDQIAPVPLR